MAYWNLLHPYGLRKPPEERNLDRLPAWCDAPPCPSCGAVYVSIVGFRPRVEGYLLLCFSDHLVSAYREVRLAYDENFRTTRIPSGRVVVTREHEIERNCRALWPEMRELTLSTSSR